MQNFFQKRHFLPEKFILQSVVCKIRSQIPPTMLTCNPLAAKADGRKYIPSPRKKK